MEGYAELNRGLWDRPDPTRDQRNRFGRAFLREGGTVLEVGCAAGEGGSLLGAGNRLFGLDVVLEYLQKIGTGYAGRLAADATRLPFRDARFDGVFAAEFIEHLNERDGSRFLLEARRVLRSGGLLLLTTPNPAYWRTRLFRIRIDGGPHLKVYAPRDLERRVRAAGFGIERRRGLGRMAFLLGQRLPLVFYGDYGLVARAR